MEMAISLRPTSAGVMSCDLELNVRSCEAVTLDLQPLEWMLDDEDLSDFPLLQQAQQVFIPIGHFSMLDWLF